MPPNDDEEDDLARRASGESRRRSHDEDFEERTPRKKKKSSTGIVLIIVGCIMLVCGAPLCIGLLLPSLTSVRHSANRMKSSNNLKQMGIAFHSYNDVNDELPGNTYSPDGKPLLSWRVHILPFVEQDNLYRQFNLDEPWDGPTNARLLNQMPKIYANPSEPSQSKTYYRGFSSPGAIFERKLVNRKMAIEKNILGEPFPGQKPNVNMSSIRDLISDTILVVDAGEPVDWTKPEDLDASPGKPLPPLGGMRWAKNKMQALMADGSVRMIRTDLPEETIRALITHSGQEILPGGWND